MDWARFLAVIVGGALGGLSPEARAESASPEGSQPADQAQDGAAAVAEKAPAGPSEESTEVSGAQPEPNPEPAGDAATSDPESKPEAPVASKVIPLGQVVEPEPEAETRPPRVVVGPLVATAFRPSRSDVIRYEPGIAYGAFVMIPLTEWLLTRASFRQELIPVSGSPGALGVQGPARPLELSQPNLSALAFSAEAEGIYRPLPRLSLRAGLGVAWARIVAPPPVGEDFYVDAERALTVSTISLSVGAAFTLIPSWLELGLRVSGGLPFAQTGRMILPLQVVVDGELAHVDPLPEMAGLLDATLELGVVF